MIFCVFNVSIMFFRCTKDHGCVEDTIDMQLQRAQREEKEAVDQYNSLDELMQTLLMSIRIIDYEPPPMPVEWPMLYTKYNIAKTLAFQKRAYVAGLINYKNLVEYKQSLEIAKWNPFVMELKLNSILNREHLAAERGIVASIVKTVAFRVSAHASSIALMLWQKAASKMSHEALISAWNRTCWLSRSNDNYQYIWHDYLPLISDADENASKVTMWTAMVTEWKEAIERAIQADRTRLEVGYTRSDVGNVRNEHIGIIEEARAFAFMHAAATAEVVAWTVDAWIRAQRAHDGIIFNNINYTQSPIDYVNNMILRATTAWQLAVQDLTPSEFDDKQYGRLRKTMLMKPGVNSLPLLDSLENIWLKSDIHGQPLKVIALDKRDNEKLKRVQDIENPHMWKSQQKQEEREQAERREREQAEQAEREQAERREREQHGCVKQKQKQEVLEEPGGERPPWLVEFITNISKKIAQHRSKDKCKGLMFLHPDKAKYILYTNQKYAEGTVQNRIVGKSCGNIFKTIRDSGLCKKLNDLPEDTSSENKQQIIEAYLLSQNWTTTDGGRKTNKCTFFYKGKKYTRVVHVNNRMKSVKINGELVSVKKIKVIPQGSC